MMEICEFIDFKDKIRIIPSSEKGGNVFIEKDLRTNEVISMIFPNSERHTEIIYKYNLK